MQSKHHSYTYDLVFGIGSACSCSENLRRRKLQVFSYPMDWLYGTNLAGRMKLLTNGFHDFFEKEHLSFLEKAPSADAYRSCATGMIFNHDFPHGCVFEKHFDRVKDKYNRRISRLYNQIADCKRILIVYLSMPAEPQDDSLAEAHNLLRACPYFKNKQVDFLYFRHEPSFGSEQIEETEPFPGVRFVRMYYANAKDPSVPSYAVKVAVDTKQLDRIFEHYRLKMPLKHKMWIVRFKVKRELKYFFSKFKIRGKATAKA